MAPAAVTSKPHAGAMKPHVGATKARAGAMQRQPHPSRAQPLTTSRSGGASRNSLVTYSQPQPELSDSHDDLELTGPLPPAHYRATMSVSQQRTSPITDLSLPFGESLPSPPSMLTSLPSHPLREGDEILKRLATQLRNWKMLGRYLLLDDKVLDSISSTYTFPAEQAIQMLKMWISRSLEPSYQALGEALHNCLKEDLVLELVQYAREQKANSLSEGKEGEVSGTTTLSSLWSDLQPFVDSFTKRGYSQVHVQLAFEK